MASVTFIPSEEAEALIDWVRSLNPRPRKIWRNPPPTLDDKLELRLARARAGISTILE